MAGLPSSPAPEPAALTRIAEAVRAKAPLVHCCSHAVSMPTVADALGAAGARPVMTASREESPHIVTGAAALLVNLGTLDADTAAAIVPTVRAAREAGLPWVLDPAAVGARTPVRTPLARTLVAEEAPALIKGNASEILVLAEGDSGGSGPDSRAAASEAAEAAAHLARTTGAHVLVSGAHDLVAAPGGALWEVRIDAPALTRITGTGCALGALAAACLAQEGPLRPEAGTGSEAEHARTLAVLAAAVWNSAAGAEASARAAGPGSLRAEWFDALDRVDPGGAGASVIRLA
ncbi:hydroxyethylthiazole kinase [Brevibacterium album]|uniref:hydroxyethylthiazole kinase n=1 Tax=Brevibacterium album TaxID=417948 RepID=UPI00040B3F1D|nr:hydroxyethylthiazole kinase [Brevibacterium album]